jgi:hypothetical protein
MKMARSQPLGNDTILCARLWVHDPDITRNKTLDFSENMSEVKKSLAGRSNAERVTTRMLQAGVALVNCSI